MEKDKKCASCREAAIKILNQWVSAVESRSVDETVKLYTDNAILVPTLSNDAPNTPEARRAYFKTFLDKDKLECEITLRVEHVNGKDDAVLIGGLYTFKATKSEVTNVIPARFLFVFEEFNGQWLITGHHSSKQISNEKNAFF